MLGPGAGRRVLRRDSRIAPAGCHVNVRSVRLLEAIRACVWLLGCCWLCGCLPLPDQDSEEKNPLILDARAKKDAYNLQGAIASLEKRSKPIPGSPWHTGNWG